MAMAVCMGVTETAAAGKRAGWLGWLWHVADMQGWPGIACWIAFPLACSMEPRVACIPCKLPTTCKLQTQRG